MISSDEVIHKLRGQGIRLTIQRRLVLEVLCQKHNHLLIQDIQQILHDQGTDLNETTIYRILQWLKELGVVSQTDLGDCGVVYQILEEEPHHHLVCLVCGTIQDIDNHLFLPLSDQLHREYGFQARIDHMAIFGKCAACQSLSPAETLK